MDHVIYRDNIVNRRFFIIIISVGRAPDSWSLTLCADHFAESADGMLRLKHAYTRDTTKSAWTLCCPAKVWKAVKETRPQSSQLTEPLWTGPGVKSGISVRKVDLHLIKTEGRKNPPPYRGLNPYVTTDCSLPCLAALDFVSLEVS